MNQGRHTILLSDAPEAYGLKDAKQVVSNALNKASAVKTVRKCKTPQGELIPGEFEVDLVSPADLQEILKKIFLEVELEDVLYVMKITKFRPSTTAALVTTWETNEPVTPTPRLSVAADVQSAPDCSVWNSDSSEDDDFEQVNLAMSQSHSQQQLHLPETVAQTSMNRIGRFEVNLPMSQSHSQQQLHLPETVAQTSMNRSGRFEEDEESPSTSRGEPMTKLFNKMPMTWFDLLQCDLELFQTYRECGVLVQSDSKELSQKRILEYFGQLSGWNPVKIIRLQDGILLIYKNQKTAKAVLKTTHRINGVTVMLYYKPVPKIYSDRILIKGNFKKNTTDEVKDILECCTGVSFKVKKLRECNMFLAVFKTHVDVAEIQKEMKKLPLKDMKPQAIKICRSDCIRVQNVKDNVTDDIIKLAFMNKKLSSGDVTLVERSDDRSNCAYVYFANYKDAEYLVQQSKNQEVLVAKRPVEVSLYCPGIKGSVEYSSNHIYQFIQELDEVESDIIAYVLKSREQTSEFHQELGDLAQVEIISDSPSSKYSVKVKPILSQDQCEDLEQEKFESDCQTKIFRFFKKFKSTTRRVPAEDRDRVRNVNQWNDDVNMVKKEIKKNEVNVLVRWGDMDEDFVTASGMPSDVKAFLNWFEESCNHTEITEKFESPEFEILMNCDIVNEFAGFFEGAVKSRIDKKKNCFTLSGSRDTVKAANNAIKDNLKRTIYEDTTFLHPSQQEFLKRTMEDTNARDNIVRFIQEKFKDGDIKVCLQCQGKMLKLIHGHHKKGELEKAKDEMRNLLKFKVIPIEIGFDEVLEEETWQKLHEDIEKSGRLCILENQQTSSITLIGLPSTFDKEFQRITEHMKDNVETETKCYLTDSETKFFSEFSREIEVDKNLASVEWYKEDGGIQLKGRACLVRKAKKWIKEIAETFSTQRYELDVPGMDEFLRGKSGEQFLKTASKDTTSVILLDSPESKQKSNERIPEPGSEEATNRVDEKAPTLLRQVGNWILGKVELTPQQEASVNVNVVNGDILQSDCEVMVNTTGEDFDLTLSKVSTMLIKESGPTIIEECWENPLIKTDKMRVTGAPNLQFKNVIHLVTPPQGSPEKIADHLLKAFKTVERKLQRQSIAVPAIGTGQIGMSVEDVAKSFRKAIDDFKKTDPKVLKRIDVVIFENKMVSTFQNALRSSVQTDSSKVKTEKASTSTSKPVAGTRSQTNGKVTVSSGNVLSSSCEVLINTTGRDFDLSASLLSGKVLLQGGNSISDECKSNPTLQSNECKVTSGGKTKFKNIVHFITPRDKATLAQNLERVLILINDQLKRSSVAIPAIGTGNARLAVDDVIQAFDTAINTFLSKNPSHLNRIDVVIFETKYLNKFQSGLTASFATPQNIPETSTKNADSLPSEPKLTSTLFSLESDLHQRHRVVLFITSNNTSNIFKAKKQIDEKAKSKCIKRPLDIEIVDKMDKEDLDDLKGIEREFNVCFIPPEDASEKRLQIWGLKDKVNGAIHHGLVLLQRYKDAVTTGGFVTWMYKDSSTPKPAWKKHTIMGNYALESMYKEDKTARKHIKLKIRGQREKVFVDLSKRIQTFDKTTNKIKRTVSGTDDLPATWDGTKDRQLVTITQHQHSEEYQEILKQFQSAGLSFASVVRLERVENKTQYVQFVAQKKEVAERIKNNPNNLPVTRELFHGTTSDVCEKICKGGFDRNWAGKNATMYGKGVYFAVTASYSHNYAQADGNGHRKMFLADVITGEFTTGYQELIDAPQRPGGSAGDFYDSVVNDPNNPVIFVVFKDASVYPLYILTYT